MRAPHDAACDVNDFGGREGEDDGTVPAQRARGGSVMEQSLSKVQAQDDAVED